MSEEKTGQEKIRVLFVDDDTRLLEGLRRNLHEAIEIFTAASGIEGLRLLDREGPFPVLVTDQNMPKVDGITFLGKVSEHFPTTICIMLSGNPDQAMLTRALHTGNLFRFLPKPCGATELLGVIREAYRRHHQIVAEKQSMEQTISGVISLLVEMLSNLYPTASRRSGQLAGWSRAAIKSFGFPKAWELETAARLWPLSYMMLPAELTKRREAGREMSQQDKVKIASSHMSVAKLLGNVPHFGGVAKLLLMCCEGVTEDHKDSPMEPQLLRILIDLCFRADPEHSEKTPEIAAQMLAARVSSLNPALVAALPSILEAGEEKENTAISMLAAFELSAGDLLLSDLHDDEGRLLLASGQTVSKTMLDRIQSLHAQGKVPEKLRVIRAGAKAA